MAGPGRGPGYPMHGHGCECKRREPDPRCLVERARRMEAIEGALLARVAAAFLVGYALCVVLASAHLGLAIFVGIALAGACLGWSYCRSL